MSINAPEILSLDLKNRRLLHQGGGRFEQDLGPSLALLPTTSVSSTKQSQKRSSLLAHLVWEGPLLMTWRASRPRKTQSVETVQHPPNLTENLAFKFQYQQENSWGSEFDRAGQRRPWLVETYWNRFLRRGKILTLSIPKVSH